MITWLLPVAAKVAIGNGVMPYLTKGIVGLPGRMKRYLVTYLFCAIMTTAFAWWLGQHSFQMTIVFVGAINAVGTYWYWRAQDISLSKTSLFGLWGDILCIVLSYVILGEGRFINTGVAIGLIFSIIAAIVFAIVDYSRKAHKNGVPIKRLVLYLDIGLSFTIYGTAAFLMRFWVTRSVPIGDFLFSWYWGCVLGAVAVYWLSGSAKKERGISFSRAEYAWISLISLSFILNLGLAFVAYRTPQVIVQPIFMIGGVALPTLIGLFVYSEHRSYRWQEWLCLGLGLLGSGLIISNW